MHDHRGGLPITIRVVALAGAVAPAGETALVQPADGGGTKAPLRESQFDPISAPTELVSLSACIRLKDLDLETDKDVAELNRRVSDAAHSLCQDLETLYPARLSAALFKAGDVVMEACDARPEPALERAPGFP